jgi:hypothetical protein
VAKTTKDGTSVSLIELKLFRLLFCSHLRQQNGHTLIADPTIPHEKLINHKKLLIGTKI